MNRTVMISYSEIFPFVYHTVYEWVLLPSKHYKCKCRRNNEEYYIFSTTELTKFIKGYNSINPFKFMKFDDGQLNIVLDNYEFES